MIPFNERVSEMGLTAFSSDLYTYSDQYGEAVYRHIKTPINPELSHPTDGADVPYFAVFTKKPIDMGYAYCGVVSRVYQFVGHDVINQRVRDSILGVGMPIMHENAVFSDDLTRMRTEMVISNAVAVPQIGDVLPVMISSNTYNGTGAAKVSFGIAMGTGHSRVTFGFSLGEMRQVHIENADTSVRGAVGDYVAVFSETIQDMISRSFSNQLTEDEMFATLDLVEKYGKRRRDEIMEKLNQIQEGTEEGGEVPLPNSWQMFLAIVRYSSFEPNINVKKMLENIAESVLVIPQRMLGVLERLQNS